MADTDYLTHTKAGDHWRKIGIKHHHGINLPLFSLRTQNSCGIGEFYDLIPLLPWCKEIGLDIIQLLPLNDSGLEASPYSALSAFALSPLHLSFPFLPGVQNDPDLLKQISLLQEMNKDVRLNYPALLNKKGHFLSDYYHRYSKEIMAQPDFRAFKQQNQWLPGYALFKTLKMYQRWQNWESWPNSLKNISKDKLESLMREYQQAIDFHTFVQFLCFLQLEMVKREAEKMGIFIKGDIPILINRDSADVWLNRALFTLNFSAGAPPDMYSVEGQNWGFPLYQWAKHEEDRFEWWVERLKTAARFYDIYRIDHIVGFFRIWGVAHNVLAKNGSFMPLEKSAWVPQGKKIMEVMLQNCPMLPIGEDLGTVPPEVRACLHSLGICGTKVMRWEKDWDGTRQFIHPKHYPPDSMTTVSTHDSETLAQWWASEFKEASEYAEFFGWKYSPQLTPEMRYKILKQSHESNSLFHISLLQEYLALIPDMVRPNLEDERINVPAIISPNNWTYRFRPSVEEIINNDSLKQALKDIIN